MENFDDPKLQDDVMMKLYEASLTGCVNTLNILMQKDPLILSRVSLYPFTETPLHIASLLGHVEFCHVLLDKNPSLATEVNSAGRCPLHLASAKGHTDIVKALLVTKPEMCLVSDKDDMLPLHFAAMRGRIGIIKEFIKAVPNSIREMTETCDGSVLHLCVRHNHLDALKLMVESVRGDRCLLLSTKDREENTILHLAVKRRQIKVRFTHDHGKYADKYSKMIKYLLSLPEISKAINTLNKEVLRAKDMLEGQSRDFISHAIEHILTEGTQKLTTQKVIAQEQPTLPQETPSSSNDPPQPTSNDPEPSPPQPSLSNSRWNRIENMCRTYVLNQGNWIDKKTREQLMVAATVIATMTFQSVISPPGGVWQADTIDGGYSCTNYGFCEAGTVVLGYAQYPDFLKFVFFNSASFFSSLCVLLVLISGFPLESKVTMSILASLMIVAASCMLLTYMWALGLVSPNHIYYRIRKLGYILVGTWAFLLGLVGLFQTTRMVFWVRSRRKSSMN
ncbi:hypothetical protein RJT34_18942 [Clitoria ternatea]|uniref:PGG domain-containing protein n=1 Tax=Clitoria ternatea TaxID=43366 RepID=A0AAN9IQ42_CLITE